MKKYAILILVLVAALLLSACSSAETKKPTSSVLQNVPDSDPFPTRKTWEEYIEHVESCECIPANYIHFSELEDFGAFRAYGYWIAYPEDGDPYLYDSMYYITDANGVEFTMAVYYGEYADSKQREALDFDESMTDMRTYPNGKSGVLCRNGINYIYSKGKLHHIAMVLEGVDIELRENAALYDYPMSGIDTPLKRLLSTDLEAASAVVEELAAKLAQ